MKLLKLIASRFSRKKSESRVTDELSTLLADEKMRDFVLTVCTPNEIRQFMGICAKNMNKWEIDEIKSTPNGEIIIWKCKKCGEKTWSTHDFPIEKCKCVKCFNVSLKGHGRM